MIHTEIRVRLEFFFCCIHLSSLWAATASTFLKRPFNKHQDSGLLNLVHVCEKKNSQSDSHGTATARMQRFSCQVKEGAACLHYKCCFYCCLQNNSFHFILVFCLFRKNTTLWKNQIKFKWKGAASVSIWSVVHNNPHWEQARQYLNHTPLVVVFLLPPMFPVSTLPLWNEGQR